MKPVPVIELRGVKKHYKLGEVTLKVLKGIDIAIKKGERVGIMGPSGSGKSTLLNMVGALDRPTHGHVLVDGIDISTLNDNELARLRGKKIGFVFQFFYLIPSITALDNVILPMTFSGKKDERRARELLKLVGLEKRMHHKPSQLSGGERQRVAIARALANNPEVLLADEPTGNLDSKSGGEIIKLLFKLNKENDLTLIIVTHDEGICSKMERNIYIKDGEIIRRGGKCIVGGGKDENKVF